jgi:hypothetical protein
MGHGDQPALSCLNAPVTSRARPGLIGLCDGTRIERLATFPWCGPEGDRGRSHGLSGVPRGAHSACGTECAGYKGRTADPALSLLNALKAPAEPAPAPA